ncbi:MAG: hypothetical protein Q7R39_06015 [Dehalococcoidia bacterium]|nr:hypothetical protein [Dehalococcoidia bacterium]
MRYLSPDYYYGLSKPLIATHGTNVWALALLSGTSLALLMGSIVIFARRDLGGTQALPSFGTRKAGAAKGISPGAQIDRSARDPWLRSVLARELRASGPALGWWALGVFLYAAYGAGIAKSSAEQLQQALAGSPLVAQILGTNILSTDHGFLSLVVFLLISIVAMVYALIRAGYWPASLDYGRWDLALSTPLPRWSAALQSYIAALIGFVMLALANAAGVIIASSATQLTVDAGQVFAASLALAPPMALIAGGVYALGSRLRLGVVMGIVGAYLGIAFTIDLMRTALKLPDWTQSLSIFSAYGTPIVDGVNWTGFGLVLLVAAFLTGVGVYLFQVGDLRQGG